MTTAIAKTETTFSEEQVGLLKRTICRGSTDDELKMFLHHCQRTGLDPFTRQIHAVKRWDNNLKREVMTIQTGIDGYRLIADRTGLYAGNDEPKYDREDGVHPNKATVTVWKMVGGQRVPFTRSARWEEFKQAKKDGSLTRFWATMPYLMLGKVAEALALRAAFPQELSGIYTHDEMAQADTGEAAEQFPTEHKGPVTVAQPEPAKQLPEPKPAQKDDLKLRAQLAQQLGAARCKDDVEFVGQAIAQLKETLSENDRAALRPLYKDALARFANPDRGDAWEGDEEPEGKPEPVGII